MSIETIHQTHTLSCIILLELFANVDKTFQQAVQFPGTGSRTHWLAVSSALLKDCFFKSQPRNLLA